MKYAKCIALSLFILWVSITRACGDTVVVEATGTSTTYELAQEVALDNAFRMAIEKVAGVYLQSQSEIKDFAVKKDEIFAESRGIVHYYDVIQQRRLPSQRNATVWLQVSCTVSWAKVKERWRTIRTTLKKKNYPRLLVTVKTYLQQVDPEMVFNKDTLQIGIESIFREAGFKLLNKDIVAEVQQRDMAAAEMEGNTSMRYALGRKFLGDLQLEFDFRARPGRSVPILDTGIQQYSLITIVQGRIFKLDTGEYVSALSKSYTEKGIGLADIVHQALLKAGNKFAKDMIHAVLQQSVDVEAREGSTIEIRIGNVTYKQVRKLKRFLRQTSGIKKLIQRSVSNKVFECEVMTNLTSENLLDLLFDIGEQCGLDFTVKATSAQRIELWQISGS